MTEAQDIRFYAGIGSRETPADVLNLMERLGWKFSIEGFGLRSGGAQGADSAFAKGAIDATELHDGQRPVIFEPWEGFAPREQQHYTVCHINQQAYNVAAEHHPAWFGLSQGAKKLHARNSQQVFGLWPQLHPIPVSFVICWTHDAKGGGGTGQAIRMAKDAGIAVFDLADAATRKRLETWADAPSSLEDEWAKQSETEIRAELAVPQHLVW